MSSPICPTRAGGGRNAMNVTFQSLDELAIYTTKVIKRLVRTRSGRDGKDTKLKFKVLIIAVTNNLYRLNIDMKMFFSTLRDYMRIFHAEWEGQEREFNNMLIVFALRLGIEKLWCPDGIDSFVEADISELVSWVFEGNIDLPLKELCQGDPTFYYFAKHSPYLDKIVLPLSDNNSFIKCCEFKNLRVIEYAGGVSDKVICNALWNTGSKKSEKILEQALTKDTKSWNLTLPHLEALRSNILNNTGTPTMKVAVGAVAFLIQPKMMEVVSRLEWGSFEAIKHLLDMEAKHKQSGEARYRKFNVTSLGIDYDEGRLDMDALRQVSSSCPKLTSVRFDNTYHIQNDMSLITGMLPMSSLKKLTLDASYLCDRELTVLIASAKNLEDLVLQMIPEAIANYNLPKLPYSIEGMTDGEYKTMSMFPPIKKLTIEFVPHFRPLFKTERSDPAMEGTTEALISFLSSFPTVEEIYFRNTLVLPPLVLVFGCFGGAIAVLFNLTHVSIDSWKEDNIYAVEKLVHVGNVSHFFEVQKLLPDLEDEVTFKHLEKLKSMEIDGIYVSRYFDQIIKALRLSGVNVAVNFNNISRYE